MQEEREKYGSLVEAVRANSTWEEALALWEYGNAMEYDYLCKHSGVEIDWVAMPYAKALGQKILELDGMNCYRTMRFTGIPHEVLFHWAIKAIRYFCRDAMGPMSDDRTEIFLQTEIALISLVNQLERHIRGEPCRQSDETAIRCLRTLLQHGEVDLRRRRGEPGGAAFKRWQVYERADAIAAALSDHVVLPFSDIRTHFLPQHCFLAWVQITIAYDENQHSFSSMLSEAILANAPCDPVMNLKAVEDMRLILKDGIKAYIQSRLCNVFE